MVITLCVKPILIHGANNMNNNYYIHPDYLNSKEIESFINELIVDYKYKSYFNFTLSDKYKLSSLISKASGRTDELNFMSETNGHYLMNLFRKYVLTQRESDKDNFVEELKYSLLNYYDDTMKEIFNYYLENYVDEAA